MNKNKVIFCCSIHIVKLLTQILLFHLFLDLCTQYYLKMALVTLQKEVIICLGSSCFARGNKQMVQLIKKFLEEHNLSGKVNFKGKHCFGNCENGPSIMIDQKRYEHINAESILEILENELL
ncbi:MAG: NADH dehydrogenase subunit E [Bacteroidetes bacterium ADurb.Bin041]|mgnify:CR=1 FL=1|jgi:NADH:ubiquinone oxidoreductase subunit E|nr:MAG: NADH dehydrogenase subunit E [Bacteroidetes bacterium ADurb.Bin041]